MRLIGGGGKGVEGAAMVRTNNFQDGFSILRNSPFFAIKEALCVVAVSGRCP